MTTTSTSTTTDLPDVTALDDAVRLLSATAHPARLLVLLALGRLGPSSAGALQRLAGIEQSAMSHQLRVLRDANLITAERVGRRVIYSLADEHVGSIVEDAVAHAAEIPG